MLLSQCTCETVYLYKEPFIPHDQLSLVQLIDVAGRLIQKKMGERTSFLIIGVSG